MRLLIFISVFCSDENEFLQIAPFRFKNYKQKKFGSLEVIIRVAIWNKGKVYIFPNVISTNTFIGNICIDI